MPDLAPDPPSEGRSLTPLENAPPERKLTNVYARTGRALVSTGLLLLIFFTAAPQVALLSLVLITAGAIYGFIGLRSARHTGIGLSQARWAAWGSFSVLFLLIAGFSWVFVSSNGAYARADRARCASNLKQIGTALILYASDNQGILPADFGFLVTHGDLNSHTFCCPHGNEASAPGATTQQVAAALRSNPTLHSSYQFLTPGVPLASLRADTIVSYEPLATHENDGLNILFADGSVRWLDEKPAETVLAELNAGKNPPPSLK